MITQITFGEEYRSYGSLLCSLLNSPLPATGYATLLIAHGPYNQEVMHSALLHHQTLTCLASRFLELSCSPRNTDFLMIACIATFCRPRLVTEGPPWFWLWFHTTSAASFSRAFSKEPCGLRMPARLSAKAEVPTVNTQVRMYVSYSPDCKNYKTQNINFMTKQLIFLWERRFSQRCSEDSSLLGSETDVSNNHTEYHWLPLQ